MSTSIYNSFKMGYKSVTRKNRTTPEKVKRALFGPVDHEANRRFLEQQLSLEYNIGCHKWNFNFREEIPIEGDGDYIWTPPSPLSINRKRKPVDISDASAYYFQPIEGSATSHILEPLKPVARSPEQAKRAPKQKLITDYMPKSKRPVVCLMKETSVEERPIKIPKLGSYCSS